MVQIVCPMCGKFSSANFKTPDDGGEVYAVYVKGLGRGKGVEVVNTENILQSGDLAVEAIKDRLLIMLKTFVNAEIISEDDMEDVFDLEIYEDVEEVIGDISDALGLEESWDEYLGQTLKNVVDRLIREFTLLVPEEDEDDEY